MPELLRLRGELEARGGDLGAAEASFAASVALAEQQGALSWRLRTEMSLARVRRQQGLADTLTGVAETYARFSEGACAIATAQAKRKPERSIETIKVSSIGIRLSSRR